MRLSCRFMSWGGGGGGGGGGLKGLCKIKRCFHSSFQDFDIDSVTIQ